MKSFNDFSIRTKLYLGFGAVLFLLTVVAYMSFDNLTDTTQSFQNLIKENIAIKDLNAKINIYMLEARRSEKDFLLRKDIAYQKRVEESISELKTDAQLLLALEQKRNNITGVKATTSMLENADIYITSFDGLVTSWQTKGLDHNSGLQGQFRNASHELAAIIKKTNDLTLQVDLLTIRKHEKDYLLRGDQKYVQKNLDQLATLQLNTFASSLTTKDKNSIKLLANEYEKGFLALVEQNKTITDDMNKMREAIHKLEPIIQNGYSRATEGSIAKEALTVKTARTNAQIPIWIAVIALLIGIFIAYYIAYKISRPISNIANIAESISNGNTNHTIVVSSDDETGKLAIAFKNLIDYMKDLAQIADSIAHNDLSVSVNPKSEEDILGNSFALMVKNLSNVIQQISASSTEVASAATEISSSAEQVAKNTQNQEMQITQITTAVEEMSATIVESSQNASEATNGAQGASETAGNGGQIVSETIEGMNKIALAVNESSENIHKLAESAEQIGTIIAVIDDIADQTNLLALNAAIEAARAGEQGRGFAVVADEVRKLAERTGKATGEITDMIKGIQRGTEEAVSSMDEGSQEVNNGRELADKAGDSLAEVVSKSQDVMNMIMQIATATEQQSAAAEEISKNIEMVSTATRESAAGAEQASTAAVELSHNAEGLQAIVNQFKL